MRVGCGFGVSTAGKLAGVAILIALLAGCAQEQAFKRGEKLAREGQYDLAVAEMESAVSLAEEHSNHKTAERYRQKLEQVKQQAGQFYYHEAELRFGRADLAGAQGLLDKCVKYCPQEQTYEAFRQRVLKATADAEQLRNEALSLAQQEQWQAAVQKMNDALAMNRTMPGGDGDLTQIKERAYRYYLDRAQSRLWENDLDGAEAEAQTALGFQPGGTQAKTVLQTVKDRREAIGWIARGRTLLEQGDAEEALRALERAAKLHPTHADLPDLLGRARRGTCDHWLEQGKQQMDAHQYAAAIHLFLDSQDLLQGYGGVDALLSDVRSQLAKAHLEASRQSEQSGNNGCAVLHATAALGYLPDSIDAGQQLARSAGRVLQEVSYTIAFAGFRGGPEPVASTFGAAAVDHLAHARPENVTLVERVDLQTILDEQDLRMSEIVTPQSRLAGGRLHRVDAMIVGQILDARVVTESQVAGHGESMYQDGFRPAPNPDHVHAARELDGAVDGLKQAERRLAEAEARLARFGHVNPDNRDEVEQKRRAQADVEEAKAHMIHAAADVGAAKMRLATIPPEVLVPNMVRCEYPIHTVSKTARVECMVKMIDIATGEVLVAERLEGRHDQSDRVIAGDAIRNVPNDPLELPDDVTMLDAAAESATTRLQQVLDQACALHGRRFLVQMQRAQSARDTTRAVDSSVQYLFAYPTGDEHTDEMIHLLRKYLGDESTLIDIAQLLRTHCHVLLD
jgi:tetratricopeptide (TPR) repeat protein